MLDNMVTVAPDGSVDTDMLRIAVKLIDGRCETEVRDGSRSVVFIVGWLLCIAPDRLRIAMDCCEPEENGRCETGDRHDSGRSLGVGVEPFWSCNIRFDAEVCAPQLSQGLWLCVRSGSRTVKASLGKQGEVQGCLSRSVATELKDLAAYDDLPCVASQHDCLVLDGWTIQDNAWVACCSGLDLERVLQRI
jgi:hypothetical protein